MKKKKKGKERKKKGKEVTRTIKGGNLKAIKEGSRRPLPGFVYPGFAASLCEPAITVCRAAYVGRDKPFLRVLSTLLLCPGSFSFRNGAAEAGHLLPLSGATIYYNKGKSRIAQEGDSPVSVWAASLHRLCFEAPLFFQLPSSRFGYCTWSDSHSAQGRSTGGCITCGDIQGSRDHTYTNLLPQKTNEK